MSRTVLVTGGAGYIGSHVAWALLDAGYNVAILDNLVTGLRSLVPPGARFIEGSTGDAELVGQLLKDEGVSAVLHFAASTVVPESVEDPLKYYGNNTANSRVLLAACLAAGVNRFVFSSTAAVYGDVAQLPVCEDAPLAPVSPYGHSKLMTEQMLRDVSAMSGLRHAALRYFNVAGADPDGRSGQSTPAATHLIKVACEAACGKRDKLTVFGTDYDTPDGTCVRDYIHVTDLADAHIRALQYLEAGGDSVTMNCGYGRGFSIREVIAAVEHACGRPLPVEMGPRREGDIMSIYADNRRIVETLNWQPQYDDLGVIVQTAYDWENR